MESERIRRHWARQLTHASLFRGVMAVIPEIASQGRAGSVLPCAVSPACHPQRLENICSMRQTSGVTTENYVGKKKIKEKQRKRFVIRSWRLWPWASMLHTQCLYQSQTNWAAVTSSPRILEPYTVNYLVSCFPLRVHCG